MRLLVITHLYRIVQSDYCYDYSQLANESDIYYDQRTWYTDVGLHLAFRFIILQRYVEDNTSDREQERRASIRIKRLRRKIGPPTENVSDEYLTTHHCPPPTGSRNHWLGTIRTVFSSRKPTRNSINPSLVDHIQQRSNGGITTPSEFQRFQVNGKQGTFGHRCRSSSESVNPVQSTRCSSGLTNRVWSNRPLIMRCQKRVQVFRLAKTCWEFRWGECLERDSREPGLR
jgi:hypothetical protein